MRQSTLFTKTLKETPSDEKSKNAQLLLKASFIQKEMAGVYVYMPLGLRVLNKIMGVIRDEMNKIGGQEVFLSALQDKQLWEKTGRWGEDTEQVWFKTKLNNDSELGLSWTHEEPMTRMMLSYVNSYRDLPKYPYQFQTKFRNELRAKSGIMRSREFIMKDLYSFSKDQAEHDEFYEKIKEAYMNVFTRCGIGDQTYVTFASGGAFSEFSHEFQTLTEAGEDTIYLDEKKKLAINKEVLKDKVLKMLDVRRDDLVEKKAIEVGNIFTLGTKYSAPLGLTYKDEEGKEQPVVMGSYGIGPGRLMGTVVEVLSDDKGMVWPREIAPYHVHIVSLSSKDKVTQGRIDEVSENLYNDLTETGAEVLWDDRENMSPGEKFADADLIGIPLRLVVSERTLQEESIEWKERESDEVKLIATEAIVEAVQSWLKE
ncbi:MAG: aminoacyl--tRNA ligase-related protein [Patescibacteria group bacterium]